MCVSFAVITCARFSDDEFSLSFFAQVVGVYQSVVESKAGGKAKLS